MSTLPASGRLAWWGTAWLRGAVGPDELIDAVQGDDVRHVVVGDQGDGSLLGALVEARRSGTTAVGAVFPTPGDLFGLRGPRTLNTAAVEAGEAALLLGAGRALVPSRVGHAVEWTALPAERRMPPDLGEADRGLRAVLPHAADTLAELDVAAWAPDAADELIDLHRRDDLPGPPGVPERCVDLAARALRLGAIVEAALADHGGALSVVQIEQRRAVLDELERAGRRALTAACSPDGWPPDNLHGR